MCLRTWQAQYKLTKDTAPQSVQKLLDALETIKKAFPTNHKQPKKGKPNPSDSVKRKMVLFNDHIPKKSHQDAKHCVLCKKHRCMHTTHNTSNCCKYEKNGTNKKGFSQGQHHSAALDKKTASAYVQLLAKIAKLEKVSIRLKKGSKKCKHDCDSNSDDLDSF
jgi:hypothetical protein